MNPRSLPLIAILLISAPAAAEDTEHALYRCRGADGVTSFQQAPCGKDQLDAGRILYDPVETPPRAGPPPAPVAPAAPPAAPQAAPPVDPPGDGSGPPGTEVADASESEAAPVTGAAPAAAPALFTGVPSAVEPPSDAVECLRPDSSTYVRSGECERSRIGGEKIEGYVLDQDTGERVWMETVTPLREVLDPARALSRLEACELARLHVEQIRAGKAPGGVYLRDAERVRDRHCD